VIVVEAAGNGAQNLDDPIYNTPAPGFPAGWTNPFNRANRDSGAIIVGAGAPPPGTHGRNHGPDRSRLDFSNFGASLDVQGWGREVTTCGYGDLQGGANEDLWYTDQFSGTSSASPIIVGTLGSLQGIVRARGAPVLTPARARQLLRTTGSTQQDAPGRPRTQRIGNRPNLRALVAALGTVKTKEIDKLKEVEKIKEVKEVEKIKETKEFVKEKDLKEFKEGVKEFKEPKEVFEKGPKEIEHPVGGVPRPKQLKEFKEQVKELKEPKEVKDLKDDKERPKEIKEPKESKEGKEIKEPKELKDGTKEIKEIKESGKEAAKETKEPKELKEGAKDIKEIKEGGKEGGKELKEFKERKEVFEKTGKEFVENPALGGDVGDRLARLEQAVGQLVHFISPELRPDLSASALTYEDQYGQTDVQALSAELEKQARDAKAAKDAKDLEKLGDR
jgi:hypothetical protein